MADLSKLPDTGYFIGMIKHIGTHNDNIHVTIDINGHSYSKNYWNPNASYKFCRDMGCEYPESRNLIGKYCVCSKQFYMNKPYLKISTISNRESEAYYQIDRLEKFSDATDRMENQIKSILKAILDTDNFNFYYAQQDLNNCLAIIKEYYQRKERGLYGC